MRERGGRKLKEATAGAAWRKRHICKRRAGPEELPSQVTGHRELGGEGWGILRCLSGWLSGKLHLEQLSQLGPHILPPQPACTKQQSQSTVRLKQWRCILAGKQGSHRLLTVPYARDGHQHPCLSAAHPVPPSKPLAMSYDPQAGECTKMSKLPKNHQTDEGKSAPWRKHIQQRE